MIKTNTHPVYLGKSLCTVFGTSNLILFFAVHIPSRKNLQLPLMSCLLHIPTLSVTNNHNTEGYWIKFAKLDKTLHLSDTSKGVLTSHGQLLLFQRMLSKAGETQLKRKRVYSS